MAEELNGPAFLSWEDYWAIAVRRRWWIILSVFLVWGMVWGLSWLLPSTYQSEALILLEQQKVPDQFVMPNVSASLQDRIQSISQQVLSRTRLQATIDRFHLYSRNNRISILHKSRDPVELMRDDISIELVRAPGHPGEFTAFKMRYSADSPGVAQQVNIELTSLFVKENVEAQQQLSEDTTSFLENQLADARVKMEKQEAKVAAFKAKHLGELPSQLESNVQILVGIQAQLLSTAQALDASRRQKLYMESLLQQNQSRASLDSGSSATGDVTGDSTITTSASADKDLPGLRLRLRDLQSRYTESHPDVVALKDKIAKAEKLKKSVEDEINGSLRSSKITNSADPATNDELEPTASPSMTQLQSQLRANQMEIENYQQHERDLESQASSYRTRLNMTPETEQELTDISRGYEESKSNYNSLMQKQMQSQLATSLEEHQKGEQFRIVDPPSLPNKPSTPNHFKVSLVGLALGIALGLGIATLLEFTDVRVRKEKDLVGIVPVSVLVGIPHLSTPGETRSRVFRRRTELGAATAMVILIVLGNLYAFVKG
jgi:polysaccharide chain length determinant protein (PEP-CTERM system associated)